MKRMFLMFAVTGLFLAGTFASAATSKGPAKAPSPKGLAPSSTKTTKINKNNKIVDKSKDNNKIIDKSKDVKIVDKSKVTNNVVKVPGTGKAAPATSYLGGKAPTAFSVKTPFRFHHCCHHHWYTGWSNYCWFGHWRCYGYYCPTACAWYYWCDDFDCYLPVSYLPVYAPTAVVVPTVVAPVAVTVTLPMGATALPASYVPVLPGTLVR